MQNMACRIWLSPSIYMGPLNSFPLTWLEGWRYRGSLTVLYDPHLQGLTWERMSTNFLSLIVPPVFITAIMSFLIPIRLHGEKKKELPKSNVPTPWTQDLCFLFWGDSSFQDSTPSVNLQIHFVSDLGIISLVFPVSLLITLIGWLLVQRFVHDHPYIPRSGRY